MVEFYKTLPKELAQHFYRLVIRNMFTTKTQSHAERPRRNGLRRTFQKMKELLDIL